MYNLIFITNLPAFYKINLFTRIAKHKKILVVFIHNHDIQRNEDFYKGERAFDFISIGNKSRLSKFLFILKLLKNTTYHNLIIQGWDELIYWIAAFISPPNKNGIMMESSILESKTNGYKGLFKKLFYSRISKAYVSGKSQADLTKALGFKGQLIVTKGVGLFNIRPQPKYKATSLVKYFIYVGRLSSEKNLQFLIETFNQLPELTLNIVGFGPQELFLKSIAKNNTVFHGAIPNAELYNFYLENDVFVLPSISEPWGIVVEEALNNGLPIIVSNKVGCSTEIVKVGENGLIFNLDEKESLRIAILKIADPQYYNNLCTNISKMNFDDIAERQVNCYL